MHLVFSFLCLCACVFCLFCHDSFRGTHKRQKMVKVYTFLVKFTQLTVVENGLLRRLCVLLFLLMIILHRLRFSHVKKGK